VLTGIGTATANASARPALHHPGLHLGVQDKHSASIAPNVAAAAAPRACGLVGELASLGGHDSWLFTIGKGRISEVNLTLRTPDGVTVTARSSAHGTILGKGSRVVVRTSPAGSVLTAAEASTIGKGTGFALAGACPARQAPAHEPPARKPPERKPPAQMPSTHAPMPPAQQDPPAVPSSPPVADAPGAGDPQQPVAPLPSAPPVNPGESASPEPATSPAAVPVASQPAAPLDPAPRAASQHAQAGTNWTLVAYLAAGVTVLLFGLPVALVVRARRSRGATGSGGGEDDDTVIFDGLTS
jgi:hypothetical protein